MGEVQTTPRTPANGRSKGEAGATLRWHERGLPSAAAAAAAAAECSFPMCRSWVLGSLVCLPSLRLLFDEFPQRWTGASLTAPASWSSPGADTGPTAPSTPRVARSTASPWRGSTLTPAGRTSRCVGGGFGCVEFERTCPAVSECLLFFAPTKRSILTLLFVLLLLPLPLPLPVPPLRLPLMLLLLP